jgi:hypothetical protein
MHLPRTRRSSHWIGAIAIACLVTSAHAADQLDLKVGLKTLPLLVNKLSGSALMAVVYDPAIAASKAEADTVVAFVGAGIEAAGGITVTAKAVPVGDLAKQGEAKLVFVTSGLSKSWDALQGSASGMLSMSTDLDCVKANRCVLGIVSQPSVSIYYSKAAADTQKIAFSDAFAMLSKKF